MPEAVSSMVQRVLVEEERLADVVPHGLEGWRIDSSPGTKIDIGKILNSC